MEKLIRDIALETIDLTDAKLKEMLKNTLDSLKKLSNSKNVQAV